MPLREYPITIELTQEDTEFLLKCFGFILSITKPGSIPKEDLCKFRDMIVKISPNPEAYEVVMKDIL